MELITTHINADFDAVASMLAASKLYPQARLAFPGSLERNVREYFPQMGEPFLHECLRNWFSPRNRDLTETVAAP